MTQDKDSPSTTPPPSPLELARLEYSKQQTEVVLRSKSMRELIGLLDYRHPFVPSEFRDESQHADGIDGARDNLCAMLGNEAQALAEAHRSYTLAARRYREEITHARNNSTTSNLPTDESETP